MTERERAENLFALWVRECIPPFDDADWMTPEDREPLIGSIEFAIKVAVRGALWPECYVKCGKATTVGFCSRTCALQWAMNLPLDDPAWQECKSTPVQPPHFSITGSI